MRRTNYARRERDFAYLKWIRSLPCFLCGERFYIEAAHIGMRGFGQLSNDRETAPACRWCHQTGPHSLHRMGKRFWAHHGIDRMALIAKLQAEYEEFQRAAA